MQTRLGSLAARIGESGWLAALVIVPLLFNVYTERVFEEDKIPLMRSIALLVGVALLVWGFERGRAALQVGERPLWRVPLVPQTLALTGAYLVATAFSLVPHISFWGAYIRRQGTYTWLSYIALFFAILLLVRQRKQVERLVTVVLLASVVPTLYGFLQNRGLDPLPWGGDVIERVSSTAGNPIFIGAYLIMVWPLTLARVIEHLRRLLRPAPAGEEPPNTLASSLLAGSYLFLLAIQTLVIIFSQSRGPWIGWGIGIVFFGILYALRHSRGLTIGFAALAVVGIGFLVTFNLPNSPLEPLREVRYIGRLGQIFEFDTGTGRVRTLIWEGATALLADNPARNVVGYGPEAMYVAFNRFYPPELGQIEQRNASPDRSHNETFDSLIMTGVVGFVAQLVLFLSFFFYVLRWLGLIETRRQGALFVGSAVGFGAAGGLLPFLAEGSFRLSGVGLPAGIALGLVAYLLGYAVTHLREVGATPPRPQTLLLIALLSAVVAHFVEVHFGIAIAATRLHFWSYVALAVVIGMPLLQGEAEESEPVAEATPAAARRPRRATRRRAGEGQPLLSGTLLGLSLLVGLILIVTTFNYVTPNVDLSGKGFGIVWLFLGAWLFGALVVTAESAFEQAESGTVLAMGENWLQRLAVYAMLSLGLWLAFCAVHLPWVRWKPDMASGALTIEQLTGFAAHLANATTLLYGFVFLAIAATAVAFGRGEAAGLPAPRQPAWQRALSGALAVALVPLIATTNLNVSRADVFNKQGVSYERSQQWDAARLLYGEALRLQPQEDRYFLNMGRALMEKGRTLRDTPDQRDLYFGQALTVLERARATNPRNTDHTRNLASLHRAWASMLDDEATKQAHLDQADSYYAHAVTLSPNNASLWNDWAALDAERGRWEAALGKLDQSLALDDRWINTFLVRASVRSDQEDWEGAIAEYDAALALNGRSLPALSGKTFALSRLERLDEAIATSQQALAFAPNDYTTLKNLALLFQQSGQMEQALESAQAALAVASPQDRPAMEAFIEELTAAEPEG